MGITIHYRGRLNDPSEVDAVLGFVQQMAVAKGWSWTYIDDWDGGADAQAARAAEDNPEIADNTALKGFVLEVDSKCEAVPLLFDASGYLRSPFSFSGSCSAVKGDTIAVKTQFAAPEAHIQIVDLLMELKYRHIADLEIMDEGEYWETNDRALLEKNMDKLKMHMDFLSEALQSEHCKGLSDLTPEGIARKLEQMLGKGTEDEEEQGG